MEKLGSLVSESLATKHPEVRDSSTDNFPVFENCPELTGAAVAGGNAEEVAKNLSGAAAPLGVNSSSLSLWLLKHDEASATLHKTVASLVE